MEAHEQRAVYVLSSIAIVWLQRHHRLCHRVAELRYRATAHVFGRLSLVTYPCHHPTHKLQAPSRLREAAALLLSGAAPGRQLDFLFRAYQTIGVDVSSLLYYCGPIIVMALSPLIFGEKLTGGKIAGFVAVACGAFLIAAQGLGGNMPIAGIVCGIASAFCYALMVIASKGAPHIEGLENSTLQVSAAFVTALVLTLITQALPHSCPPRRHQY